MASTYKITFGILKIPKAKPPKCKISKNCKTITEFYYHKDVLKTLKQKESKMSKSHPGFKAVQAKISKKEGVSKKAAGAILANATRKVSLAAKKGGEMNKLILLIMSLLIVVSCSNPIATSSANRPDIKDNAFKVSIILGSCDSARIWYKPDTPAVNEVQIGIKSDTSFTVIPFFQQISTPAILDTMPPDSASAMDIYGVAYSVDFTGKKVLIKRIDCMVISDTVMNLEKWKVRI
jgi:hypothetical protein